MIGLQGQSTDRDAGSAGAHRVPQAGVARIHPATGRGGGAQGPRIRRRAPRAAASPTAAATSSPSCSSRCRRWSSRTTSASPRRTAAQFDGWTDAIVAANTAEGGIAAALETVGDAVGSMMAYFTQLIERRRTEPEDDTISHLVAAGVGADGDIAGVLSVLALHLHDGHRRKRHHHRNARRRRCSCCTSDPTSGVCWSSSPTCIPGRRRRIPATHLAGPSAGPHRHSRRDDRRHHHAGRSPSVAGLRLRQPRRAPIRSGRRRTRRQRRPRNILTFSHGAHHCLGAAAARMQSRVALTELLSRCPDFEVDEDNIVWAGGSYVRRPLSVPFRVDVVDAGQRLARRAPHRGGGRPYPRRRRGAVHPPRSRFGGHERDRQGRRVFPRDAVPLFREP